MGDGDIRVKQLHHLEMWEDAGFRSKKVHIQFKGVGASAQLKDDRGHRPRTKIP